MTWTLQIRKAERRDWLTSAAVVTSPTAQGALQQWRGECGSIDWAAGECVTAFRLVAQ